MRFIHAADIHLDSPLRGLERYEGAPVSQIRLATRAALDNLVRLAIAEHVDFVLIAGDVYDGDWKDYNTGLFFSARMSRLRECGIPVFLISGNHDAESQISKSITLPDNVKKFSDKKAETIILEKFGVAIHGQSFGRRDVTENLCAAYPFGEKSLFNIGMLHTCADGRAGHEKYAPCRIDDMRSREYQYWALGHVHNREIISAGDPYILFPGNIQGRNVRETGAKGCSIVTVEHQKAVSVEALELDTLRWAVADVNATGTQTVSDIIEKVREQVRVAKSDGGGRTLAMRIEIRGSCHAHRLLMADSEQAVNDIRAAVTDESSGDVWAEKVKFMTDARTDYEDYLSQNTPLAELIKSIGDYSASDELAALLREDFKDLQVKLPRELKEEGDKLDLSDLEKCRELIDEAKALLIPRLLWPGGAPNK